MKKLQRIREKEVRIELLKTFRQVKKDLFPLMNQFNFRDITPLWWLKRIKEEGCMGLCYHGTINFNRKSKKWYKNPILLSKNYYQTNGIDDLIGVWKHELVHLVAKDKHGKHFIQLAVGCGAKRFCSHNK